MATVFRLKGRPYWFAQIRLPDGTRPPYRSTKKTKKRDAVDYANEWEAKARREQELGTRNQGRALLSVVMEAERLAGEGMLSASKAEGLIRKLHVLSDPKSKPVSLRSHWDAVIRRETGVLADSTISGLEYARDRWAKALGRLMDAPLAKLTLEDFEIAFPKMAQGLSVETVSLYRSMLMKVLRDAVGRRLIDNNPAQGLKTATRLEGLTEQPKRGVFTPEELQKLLNAADEEWRGMVLAGFYTSLRLMDVARLGSADVEDGFLIVTSSKTATKTDTPIHPRLKSWIEGREGAFFPKQAVAGKATVSSRFSALMKKAGVPKLRVVRKRTFKRSYHSLRHTFTSIVANAEVPQDVRMALTGSSDARIASRYVHTSDEALMGAIAALPSLELEEGAA